MRTRVHACMPCPHSITVKVHPHAVCGEGAEPRSRRINSDFPSASVQCSWHAASAARRWSAHRCLHGIMMRIDWTRFGASRHGAGWMMQSCAAAGEDQETSEEADAESFYTLYAPRCRAAGVCSLQIGCSLQL